jgi:rubrerythrin
MTGIVFNANEVFEMAKRIEVTGGKFYRKAAEVTLDARDLLLQIADQEDRHLAIFTEMQRSLTPREAESTAFDPYDEGDLYLKAMADGRVFDTSRDPAELLREGARVMDILDFALGIEKDSIVFYLGMREMVPKRLGMEKVDRIIREEMKHIAWLTARATGMKDASGVNKHA